MRGKIVVVTGGTSGIGEVAALAVGSENSIHWARDSRGNGRKAGRFQLRRPRFPLLKVLRRSSDLSDLGFQLVDQDALVFRIVNRRDN
jgi:NAD(P)-dependent dehydrogenase (short-subunit alcohol dehydrogenase family)